MLAMGSEQGVDGPIRLFTIGFTRKTAERFFSLLTEAGVRRVLDVRLNNTSQLAGFAKVPDLAYFLRVTGGIEYQPVPELAPTEALLGAYRARRIGWAAYAASFRDLLRDRGVEAVVSNDWLNRACLLCSEPTPERCHRRLVAEYLREVGMPLEIIHL
jgi:uncharacterized protein (DUF488 family)